MKDELSSGEETSEKDPVRGLEEAKVKSSFGTSQTYTFYTTLSFLPYLITCNLFTLFPLNILFPNFKYLTCHIQQYLRNHEVNVLIFFFSLRKHMKTNTFLLTCENYLPTNHLIPPHQHYASRTQRNTNVSEAFVIGKDKMRCREVRASFQDHTASCWQTWA